MVRFISSALWPECLLAAANSKAASHQHRRKHRIIQQQQSIWLQVKSHMAIAEVISSLQQLQRRLSPHLQKLLLGSHHMNKLGILTVGKKITRSQRARPGQLQQDLLTAQRATTTSQRCALLSRERQLQAMLSIRPLTMTPLQNNHRLAHARRPSFREPAQLDLDFWYASLLIVAVSHAERGLRASQP